MAPHQLDDRRNNGGWLAWLPAVQSVVVLMGMLWGGVQWGLKLEGKIDYLTAQYSQIATTVSPGILPIAAERIKALEDRIERLEARMERRESVPDKKAGWHGVPVSFLEWRR